MGGGGVTLRGASARKEQNGLLYATAETDSLSTMRICLKVLSDEIDLAESGINRLVALYLGESQKRGKGGIYKKNLRALPFNIRTYRMKSIVARFKSMDSFFSEFDRTGN